MAFSCWIISKFRHGLKQMQINSEKLTWKRTGKITMRAEPYLIMRLPTHYLAMYGQKTERITIGKYPDAETAKTACEEYRQKNASTG